MAFEYQNIWRSDNNTTIIQIPTVHVNYILTGYYFDVQIFNDDPTGLTFSSTYVKHKRHTKANVMVFNRMFPHGDVNHWTFGVDFINWFVPNDQWLRSMPNF